MDVSSLLFSENGRLTRGTWDLQKAEATATAFFWPFNRILFCHEVRLAKLGWVITGALFADLKHMHSDLLVAQAALAVDH